MSSADLHPVRLTWVDVTVLAFNGLRSRPGRAILSGLGIAIGVAAMVAVVGVSFSSRADLNRTLDRLGTNLLRVSPAPSTSGEPTVLPAETLPMVSRIAPVQSAAAVAALPGGIYRTPFVPSGRTSSVTVMAATARLPETVGTGVTRGRWFHQADMHLPAVILGHDAAARLGVNRLGDPLWVSGRWFSVIGVLAPVTLDPALDSAALVPWPVAVSYLGFDGHPSTVYLRAEESQVEMVAQVLPASAKPQAPAQVQVSRPSDALTARREANRTLTALFLGLGAVSLLVGSIGVGNIMIISVLERRSEIGLRRALGATRRHVRAQFLAEALVLSTAGGAAGVALGAALTVGYCLRRGWPVLLPGWTGPAGVGVAVVIGAVAGVYPAWRASRLSPTEALNSF